MYPKPLMKCEWPDCSVAAKTKEKRKKRESNLMHWGVGRKRTCVCEHAVR